MHWTSPQSGEPAVGEIGQISWTLDRGCAGEAKLHVFKVTGEAGIDQESVQAWISSNL